MIRRLASHLARSADMPKEWNLRWAGKPAGYRRPNGHTVIAVYHVNHHAIDPCGST